MQLCSPLQVTPHCSVSGPGGAGRPAGPVRRTCEPVRALHRRCVLEGPQLRTRRAAVNDWARAARSGALRRCGSGGSGPSAASSGIGRLPSPRLSHSSCHCAAAGLHIQPTNVESSHRCSPPPTIVGLRSVGGGAPAARCPTCRSTRFVELQLKVALQDLMADDRQPCSSICRRLPSKFRRRCRRTAADRRPPSSSCVGAVASCQLLRARSQRHAVPGAAAAGSHRAGLGSESTGSLGPARSPAWPPRSRSPTPPSGPGSTPHRPRRPLALSQPLGPLPQPLGGALGLLRRPQPLTRA